MYTAPWNMSSHNNKGSRIRIETNSQINPPAGSNALWLCIIVRMGEKKIWYDTLDTVCVVINMTMRTDVWYTCHSGAPF